MQNKDYRFSSATTRVQPTLPLTSIAIRL